jgi:hypothetical protein
MISRFDSPSLGAAGKSSREIQRCLKRYIARELYRALNASTTLTAHTLAHRRPLDKHRSVTWSRRRSCG